MHQWHSLLHLGLLARVRVVARRMTHAEWLVAVLHCNIWKADSYFIVYLYDAYRAFMTSIYVTSNQLSRKDMPRKTWRPLNRIYALDVQRTSDLSSVPLSTVVYKWGLFSHITSGYRNLNGIPTDVKLQLFPNWYPPYSTAVF
jgi:hypothetical protein